MATFISLVISPCNLHLIIFKGQLLKFDYAKQHLILSTSIASMQYIHIYYLSICTRKLCVCVCNFITHIYRIHIYINCC